MGQQTGRTTNANSQISFGQHAVNNATNASQSNFLVIMLVHGANKLYSSFIGLSAGDCSNCVLVAGARNFKQYSNFI
jgi:hypothetical protein